MGWKPDITVAAIVERDGRFLCVEERINGRLVYNQPVGHVEPGEDFIAAVIRETREETAWQLEPEALLGVYSWQSPRSGRSTLRFAFTGHVHSHDPGRALDQPIVAAHWLSRAQLLDPSRRLRTGLVLRCIDDFLAGRRLPLSAIGSVVGE